MTRLDKVSHFSSLARLRDFFMKSRETCETFKTLKFQCKYSEKWQLWLFYCIFMWQFFEKVDILGIKIFTNWKKKSNCYVLLESKIAWSWKWPPDHFYCIFVWQSSVFLDLGLGSARFWLNIFEVRAFCMGSKGF